MPYIHRRALRLERCDCQRRKICASMPQVNDLRTVPVSSSGSVLKATLRSSSFSPRQGWARSGGQNIRSYAWMQLIISSGMGHQSNCGAACLTTTIKRLWFQQMAVARSAGLLTHQNAWTSETAQIVMVPRSRLGTALLVMTTSIFFSPVGTLLSSRSPIPQASSTCPIPQGNIRCPIPQATKEELFSCSRLIPWTTSTRPIPKATRERVVSSSCPIPQATVVRKSPCGRHARALRGNHEALRFTAGSSRQASATVWTW
mmetsp:Transcript_128212/g.256061  ORF Transcript_128212/g.256061 Transcript_128212/m.256061 type:complete len:259 (-) Transcript_128212:1025-1801(-)